MRFNKDTEKGINIDEIARQCMDAVIAADTARIDHLETCFDLPAYEKN